MSILFKVSKKYRKHQSNNLMREINVLKVYKIDFTCHNMGK